MTRARKRYTREFKDEACGLVTAQGYAPADAARQLGVSPQTLGEWLKARGWRATVDHQPAPGDSDDPAVLKLQLRELQSRVRRLELEMEILKKATAFFAREQP